MKHGLENIIRVNNLMYNGCEPHWKCKKCGMCVPFHCYNKEQFAEKDDCRGEKNESKA